MKSADTDIDRRDFVKSMGLGTAALALGNLNGLAQGATEQADVSSKPGRKPNVVLVYVDQLRTFSMGCHGNRFIQTPYMDQLAAEGFRFDLGVTNSPVCVPARSNLMSGQHARTCVGSRMNEMPPYAPNDNDRLLGSSQRRKFPGTAMPEAFKKLGYKTAHIGKWHIDARPSTLGFDESIATVGIFSRAEFIDCNDDEKRYRVPVFSADHEIAKVSEFFKNNRSEPFFLYYNIISPHMPVLDVPYKYSRMYDPDKVPLRDNVWKDGKLPSDEDWFQIYLWQTRPNAKHPQLTGRVTPDFTLRDLTALYYGSVSWTDDLLGQMMKSLKDNRLEDNTIVVFTSDHGDLLGSQHMWNKDRLYEEAIRVPLIYRWPGHIRPTVNSAQVTSTIDVMPTLLDLCGGEIPDSVQGRSMAPLLLGKHDKDCFEDNFALIETSYAELGIRTPTHLYGVEVGGQGPANDRGIKNDRYQFFDLRNDPYEQHNLAETDQQAALAGELRERLVEWDRQTPCLEGVKYRPWNGSVKS